MYLGTAESNFKEQVYNHRDLFNNDASTTITTLSKCVWELKEATNLSPTLAWSIAKKVLLYSDISKKCLLCLHQKLEIMNYPRPDKLVNKRSELISKSCHTNKFPFCNYKIKH